MSMGVVIGDIRWAIGRLECWDWYLSVEAVETVLNRKHLFGNFFWRYDRYAD